MNFVNFSEFIKADLDFHSDPQSTDISLWGVSVICDQYCDTQVCFILTFSNTSVYMQLSPITAVVATKNRTQLLFIIKKRISEKNRETAAHLHSHKLKSVWFLETFVMPVHFLIIMNT